MKRQIALILSVLLCILSACGGMGTDAPELDIPEADAIESETCRRPGRIQPHRDADGVALRARLSRIRLRGRERRVPRRGGR